MIVTTREQRRQLKRDNQKMPVNLKIVPPEEWPASKQRSSAIGVWRSRDFLVQAYRENGAVRLSIGRTELGNNGRWLDNITWDELQELKRQAGYGERYAIEIYPKDKDVVNVANLRHLWVLDEPLNIGWLGKSNNETET